MFSGITARPFDIPQTALTVTMSGKYAQRKTITVPTSDTTLDKGSIGTVGWVYIQNLDGTNYIQIGDGTNWLIRLNPGDPPFQGRWDTGTPHVKAHTGACDIDYALFEA